MADKERCALITGASKGIGKAIALRLANDHGLHILINYSTDSKAASQVLQEITSAGGSGELLQFKVQERPAVDKAIKSWLKDNPSKVISILVNNAGITKDSWFMWMPEQDWDDVVDTSLKGMFNVTQSVIKQMIGNKYGRIVNISSLAGRKGIPGQTNYSAAKSAVIGASKALAQEVAKMNITVNAIAPGFVNTDMLEKIDMDRYIGLIPMGRVGEPDEVAHLVSFLASDRASYITGEVININGGMYS